MGAGGGPGRGPSGASMGPRSEDRGDASALQGLK